MNSTVACSIAGTFLRAPGTLSFHVNPSYCCIIFTKALRTYLYPPRCRLEEYYQKTAASLIQITEHCVGQYPAPEATAMTSITQRVHPGDPHHVMAILFVVVASALTWFCIVPAQPRVQVNDGGMVDKLEVRPNPCRLFFYVTFFLIECLQHYWIIYGGHNSGHRVHPGRTCGSHRSPDRSRCYTRRMDRILFAPLFVRELKDIDINILPHAVL